MNFRTEVAPPAGMRGMIDHTAPTLMLGSCFTDNVGSRMRRDWFDVVANPFGALYNPASISLIIRRIASGEDFNEADLHYDERSQLFHTFLSHTQLSAPDAATCLRQHQEAFATARRALLEARAIVITLGTARVFQLADSGAVVANCHKLPASQFTERMLTVAESAEMLRAIAADARVVNPGVKTIVTISPIRHRGNRPQDNSVSKATLVMAADEFCRTTPDAVYFPAFEIMLDDLRDYRFYESDMRHPSAVAADYIYSMFGKTFFTESTMALAERCRKIESRMYHRPLSSSPLNKSFDEETRRLTEALIAEHPYLRQAKIQ